MNSLQDIFIGSVALMVLIGFSIAFVVYYKQKQAQQKIALQELKAEMQRQMLENSLEVQETERRRIAKDLHDVGAMLSATKMSLKLLSRQAVGQEQILTLADNTKEMLEESIGHVRRISKELVPSTLEGFGLVVALEEFISKLQPMTETEFELKYENLEHEERFDRKIELTIYRIAQELVNNAFKHAEAEKISLQLLKSNKNIVFNFTDNGKGFDLDRTMKDPKSGLGLRNIESRLSVVSGKLAIKSSIGNGTITRIEIPFPEKNV
jgi:signal transduction histidine kinase